MRRYLLSFALLSLQCEDAPVARDGSVAPPHGLLDGPLPTGQYPVPLTIANS